MKIFGTKVLLLLISILMLVGGGQSYSKQKPKKSVAKRTKVASTKSHSKSGGNRKSKTNNQENKEGKINSKLSFSIKRDSLISEGIIYRELEVQHDSLKTIVHTVTCALRNSNYNVSLLKAHDRLDALESLESLINKCDTIDRKTPLAAINTCFWKAGTNNPVGLNVVNGEVLEFERNKSWHSIFFDSKNRAYIDTFSLNASIRTFSDTITIASINKRDSINALALYNSYIGGQVPYVSPKSIERELEAQEQDFNSISPMDSTEMRITNEEKRLKILEFEQQNQLEFNMSKVLLRYLRPPAINQEVPLMVLKKIESGQAYVPLRGVILTMPKEKLKSMFLSPGDTVYLKISTNKNDSVPFLNSISGTPRLVSHGDISENVTQSSNSSYFTKSRLPRTALGTDILKTSLYLITVCQNDSSKGFTIPELALFCKKFGAFHALNLDGGGSSQLAIGKEILFPTTYKRRISQALAITRKKQYNRIK